MRKIAIIVLSLLVYLLACQQGSRKQSVQWHLPPEVDSLRLLLGVDGADWRFVQPLIKQGKLPAFAKLARRGTRADLMSQTMASPVEWTIIGTGRTPEENGVTGFVVHDPKRGKKAVVSGNLRKVKAFWNILSDAARQVCVLGWWATWPAEGVKGILISDLFPYRATLERTCSPESIRSSLEQQSELTRQDIDRIIDTDFKGFRDYSADDQQGSLNEDELRTRLGLFRRDFRYDLEKAAYARFLLPNSSFQQAALFLNSTDIASHLFYQFTDVSESAGGWPDQDSLLENYGTMIEMAYRYAEKPLIDIMESVHRLQQVCIVSDHGFTAVPYIHKVRWNQLLHDLGLLTFRTGSAKKNFRNIDRDRSFAFYDPRYPTEGLRIQINNEYKVDQDLKMEKNIEDLIEQKLLGIVDQNGQRLFVLKHRNPKERYIDFNVRTPLTTAGLIVHLSGKKFAAERYSSPPHLSGGHRRQGVLLLWGAGVRQGQRLFKPTTYDITPTILWLNDLPVSDQMKGRVLVKAYTPEALLARPVQTIERFATRSDISEISGPVVDQVDTTIKSKLKALGYID